MHEAKVMPLTHLCSLCARAGNHQEATHVGETIGGYQIHVCEMHVEVARTALTFISEVKPIEGVPRWSGNQSVSH